MTTDRELLELAAKAAGLRVRTWEGHSGIRCAIDDGRHGHMWMPLTDDGDALRLAADLRLGLEWGMATVRVDCCAERYCDGDAPRAVARRAIVRAAAEIGKAMR